jgi:hypothetical protein
MVFLAAEVLVVGGILVMVYTGALGPRPYKLNEPYDEVAGRLREAGFRGGTLVAGMGPLGGNLRLQLPGTRVLSVESPYYVPPAVGPGGQCLLVWERGRFARVPPDLRELLARALGGQVDEAAPPTMIEARVRHATTRTRRVAYVLLPEGTGRCR